MRKSILTILMSLFFILSFAQVENATFLTRYSTFYEYNTYTDKFELTNEAWMETYLTASSDYYNFKIEDGEWTKVYWEYYEKNEYGNDVYYTRDERKVVFDYENQRIIFYYEYSEYEKLYTKYIILDKLSKL
tara:strand:+ start:2182 stop:2577 length:396 start_codon:yes stop_codon:yes gene_type:complete